MDRDAPSGRAPNGGWKAGIEEELEDSGGFSWIPSEREIDNELDLALLQQAVEAVHSRTRWHEKPRRNNGLARFPGTWRESTSRAPLRV